MFSLKNLARKWFFKLLERVLDPNIREMGNIDETQFLLVPVEGTTDAHRRQNCDWSGCRWHHA